MGRLDRTELLIGKNAIEKLKNSKVAVFGAGGVGGAVIEALARAGIGTLDITDPDAICETNLNRQILTGTGNIGAFKVEAAKKRIADIAPDCTVIVRNYYFSAETAGEYDFSKYDYVIDAIDMVSAKIELAVRCDEAGTPLIMSMGTGNKLNPGAFEVADISKTSVCPLARTMRYELKKRGINHVKCVYSKEIPAKTGSSVIASISFVPPAAGLLIASVVVRELIGNISE